MTRGENREAGHSDTWTVRGISQDTRDAVKLAARQSGIAVGAYVESALKRAAAETILREPIGRPQGQDALADLSAQIAALRLWLQDRDARRTGGFRGWLFSRFR